MRHKSKSMVTKSFLWSLAIISILGFIGIMAQVWLGFDLIVKNAAAYMLIILGFGLAVEGQVRKWKNFRSGGYSSTEIAHVVTGIIGMIAIFVGILDLTGLEGPTLMAMQGIISMIAVIIIIFQTWVVD